MVELDQTLNTPIDNQTGAKQSDMPSKTPYEIASEVTEKYGFDLDQIRGKKGQIRLNLARIELAKRLCSETDMGIIDIGEFLSRDRQSIQKRESRLFQVNNTAIKRPTSYEFHRLALAVALSYEDFQIHPGLNSLKSRSKTHPVAEARQIFCYLLYTNFPVTTTEIGQFLGSRDHSTIHSAIRVVEKRLKADSSFASRVQGIQTKINENENRNNQNGLKQIQSPQQT